MNKTLHYTQQNNVRRRGFTLIEILVVIGMIAILATAVLVGINPQKQFGQARNAKRMSDVNAILSAVTNRIADNNGQFMGGTCDHMLISETKNISDTGEGIDLDLCLVPEYISQLPLDPTVGKRTSHLYSTGYTIALTGSRRVTVCAPETVTDGLSEPYCITR